MDEERRLSERILMALELAVEQNDAAICEKLVAALELSMTRASGGADFTERRELSEQAAALLDQSRQLLAQSR